MANRRRGSIYDHYEEPRPPLPPSAPAEEGPLPVADSSAPKLEKFCRMKKVEVDNSYWPAFQAELIFIENDKVVKRELIGKPDMFENAYSNAALEIDPRND